MNHDVTARAANARNNAMYQSLRLDRWRDVRGAVWDVLDPLLASDARVLVVGAGNGDDLPLTRMAGRVAHIDLADIDADATRRARERLAPADRARVHALELDVTDGAVDRILRGAVGSWWRQPRIDPPTGPIGAGSYDLVLGDMLYTQLLHPALIARGMTRAQQTKFMRRYDDVLRDALLQRLHASAHDDGVVVHIHDVACWARDHAQPLTVAAALENPEAALARLRRHDRCDPHVGLERLGITSTATAWWHWPFEPATSFLVRASIAPARATDGNVDVRREPDGVLR